MKQVESITRQPKGNQDFKRVLEMKANELEKLFTQYKLGLADRKQVATSSRTTTNQVDVQQQLAQVSCVELPAEEQDVCSSTDVVEVHAISLLKIAAEKEKNIVMAGGLSRYPISRGKYYDLYMMKRDAKLREEGIHQKEQKLRAMQESIERARAEMILTTNLPVDRQTHEAPQQVVQVTPFTITSAMKNIIQKPCTGSVKDEDYLGEFPQHTRSYGLDRSMSGAVLGGDGSSRTPQSKKLLRNRTLTSSSNIVPPSPAPSIPRPSIKSSISFSGRRRVQPEIPLAPNLSDSRKESTKPFPGINSRAAIYLTKERSKSAREADSYYKTFNSEDYSFKEVQPSCSSFSTPLANVTLSKDQISGSSIKAPRSFFSLSSLRNKGSNSKPR